MDTRRDGLERRLTVEWLGCNAAVDGATLSLAVMPCFVCCSTWVFVVL